MGLNKGKYYDAKLTRQLCDGMSDSTLRYKESADDTHQAYGDFDKNELFHGTAATALKTFMVGGTGKMLTEITDIHRQMVDDQTYLISSFEAMVDPSPAARIEYDTLDIINTDFKGYSNTFTGIASDVDSIVNSLNAEFGSYDHFPKPDSKSAKNGFVTICGGEGNGGFFKECQNKFIGFDSEVTTYLKGRDTADHCNNIIERINGTVGVLGNASTGSYKPANLTVSTVNNYPLLACSGGGALALDPTTYDIMIQELSLMWREVLAGWGYAVEEINKFLLVLPGILAAGDGPAPIGDLIALGLLAIDAIILIVLTIQYLASQKSESASQDNTEEKDGDNTKPKEGDADSKTGEETGYNGFPKKINPGQQKKHIRGTNENKVAEENGQHKSVLDGDLDDAQELLDEYSGKGEPVSDNKERVDFGKTIGQYYDTETGEYVDTTKGIIHYGKNGAHIVPAHP